MMTFKRYEAAVPLRDYIQGYWHIRSGDEFEKLDLVPDGHPEIFFILKNGMEHLGSNGKMKACPKAGFIGQLTRNYVDRIQPHAEILYVKLYPWAPYPFFKIPCWELNDQTLDLTTLGNHTQFRQLAEDIRSTENILKAVAILDHFFLEKHSELHPHNPFVSFAVQKIYETHGTISIEALTSNIHASRRYVEKVFKRRIGMSPKQYARLIRVKKASLMLLEGNFTGSISRVAAQLDYYDQSHFLKDFKAVVKRTPTEYLRKQGNLPLNGLEEYLGQWDYS